MLTAVGCPDPHTGRALIAILDDEAPEVSRAKDGEPALVYVLDAFAIALIDATQVAKVSQRDLVLTRRCARWATVSVVFVCVCVTVCERTGGVEPVVCGRIILDHSIGLVSFLDHGVVHVVSVAPIGTPVAFQFGDAVQGITHVLSAIAVGVD